MRYFLGFLAAIGLIVLVIILIVRGLSGGDEAAAPKTALTDYSDTATTVRLTIDGPLTANEKHYAVRVTVGRDGNELEVIQGYEGDVVLSQNYENNEAAYTNFLKALQLQGFTKGAAESPIADERGRCPMNKRYIYEIVSPGGATTQRFWSSDCKIGTFAGNGATIRSLFKKQIPDYNKAIRGYGVN